MFVDTYARLFAYGLFAYTHVYTWTVAWWRCPLPDAAGPATTIGVGTEQGVLMVYTNSPGGKVQGGEGHSSEQPNGAVPHAQARETGEGRGFTNSLLICVLDIAVASHTDTRLSHSLCLTVS